MLLCLCSRSVLNRKTIILCFNSVLTKFGAQNIDLKCHVHIYGLEKVCCLSYWLQVYYALDSVTDIFCYATTIFTLFECQVVNNIQFDAVNSGKKMLLHQFFFSFWRMFDTYTLTQYFVTWTLQKLHIWLELTLCCQRLKSAITVCVNLF